jgi:uncharacterized membrane protein YczE
VTAAGAGASRWVPTPLAATRLLAGLVLFGAGDALILFAALGNTPWTVLAEGIAEQTPLTVGTATVVVSLAVLSLWPIVRQAPGIGTVANALIVGLVIDATLRLLPDSAPLAVRATCLLFGIVVVAVGSGLYLGARLGPGPRDGLMTGIHRRTGWAIAPVRVGLELSAVVGGALLGGRVGIGTLAFALAIGPAVALALRLLYQGPASDL